MSKKLDAGVWVVVCDWVDPETDAPCNLGHEEMPAMFIDPDRGLKPDTHFQCGSHHGIVKQSSKEEYQLPEDHKLDESSIKPQGNHRAEDIGVSLEGFVPDLGGHVWDGKSKVGVKGNSNE